MKHRIRAGCAAVVVSVLVGSLVSACGLTKAQLINLQLTTSNGSIVLGDQLSSAEFVPQPGGRHNAGAGETNIIIANDTFQKRSFVLVRTNLAPKDAWRLPHNVVDALQAGQPSSVIAVTPLIDAAVPIPGSFPPLNNDSGAGMHIYIAAGVHYLLLAKPGYKRGLAYEIYQPKPK